MGKIKVLPEEVVNKIAAGEVIEKPSSIVKELVENSLDAQANSISVSVKHGGKELIRVTDNGEGMSPEDAAHSLQRHATSKIEAIEDIFRIRSFGFRGEALPSIAAVSQLTLLTRASGADFGTEIKVAGGLIESIREIGIALGTTVEVAHLFFNTPARRKFLRTEKAELFAIVDTFTTFALGNPAVAFKLVKDSTVTLDTPSCFSLRERIGQIHGEEVVEALIPVQTSTAEIKFSGFVTEPAVSRVNRTGQYFYINNRPVTSPGLSFALRHAYEDTLSPHRYPLAFLFFDIESSRVDVNVHPNKMEVRIANEREVQKLLIESVRQALHTQKKFPKVHLKEVHTWGEDLVPSSDKKVEKIYYPETNGSLALTVVHEAPTGFSSPDQDREGIPCYPVTSERVLTLEGEESEKIPRIIGQYHATYIIAETDGKLFIIDQHAAHERIMYENILDTLISTHSLSQRQLIPVTFSLDYREQEVLEEYLPLLEQLGFGINHLGRNTYSVDAVPALLNSVDPRVLLLDFIHDAMEGYIPRDPGDKKKALAAGIACKSKSVKGSSYLLPEKMEYLVKSLFQTREPFTCPHGRPTCITLTLPDLEKQFGRK
ncbi:MAG: DNA mismatch repair endonuclease MutL [Pseudomonadota bacterium]